MFVKNWSQVYKSLAVWLPIISSALFVLLQEIQNNVELPLWSIPIIVAITAILGWVKKQPSINKGNK